ncbi:disulfide bond formation protein B [Flavobacterium sp. LS1R49]|uniref:Disulfide bond formation protein B n=1 Tax=Flavobacterium shii TaxID=2987687 RepID=A0A9X3BX55_9FLAO|nr:disulfide bond formation protein B [Flavobacterium shii]MCV9926695.1 disulfide bond formation protein B [Flavobacterium shii]
MSKQVITYINILGMFIISAILCGAYYFQFRLNEFPCPLCLLQRMCFLGIIFGLYLNLKFGFNPTHYGLSILSAIIGASISYRQVLLHICPNPDDHGYGTPIFGMHLYTWALIAFVVSIIIISILLLAPKQFKKKTKKNHLSPTPLFLTEIAFGIVLILVLTNVFFTFMECGFGFCPDDPISYQILNGHWW